MGRRKEWEVVLGDEREGEEGMKWWGGKRDYTNSVHIHVQCIYLGIQCTCTCTGVLAPVKII